MKIDKTDPRIRQLADAVYGKGRYKNGWLHHWTRLVKCWDALEDAEGDYDLAFERMLEDVYGE